jgi:hypothetical protein
MVATACLLWTTALALLWCGSKASTKQIVSKNTLMLKIEETIIWYFQDICQRRCFPRWYRLNKCSVVVEPEALGGIERAGGSG